MFFTVLLLIALCFNFLFIFFLIKFLAKKDKYENETCKELGNAKSSSQQQVKCYMGPTFMHEVKLKEKESVQVYNHTVTEFEFLINKHSFSRIDLSETECVILIEEKLPIYIGLKSNKHYISHETGEYDYIYHIKVEELLHNDIFKFNATKFTDGLVDKFNIYLFNFYIRKFYGLLNASAQGIDEKGNMDASEFSRINNLLPELNLQKRYEEWGGIPYYFVIFEYEHGEKTKQEIRKTKLKNVNNFANSYYSSNSRWMFCKNPRFYYFQDNIKEETLLEEYCQKALDDFNNGILKLECHSYTHPENKWKSEQQVYEMCKKIYGKNKVIYQYQPYFLGQMSYDVYIVSKNVAIEYQGKQHFEPVEFFGGQEHFEQQVKRDERKKWLSEQNGIKLVYINYDEDISEELIKQRVEEASIGYNGTHGNS